MKFLTLPALALLAITPSISAFAEEGHHWGYEGEGDPSVWAELSDEFKACGIGQEQSPIDIVPAAATKADFAEAVPHWEAFVPTVVNNGHTIQVNTNGAGGYADLGGVKYDLLQFHFHHQSEHTIDGKHAPMEVHFVHKSAAGDLLVLGVLLEEGASNSVIDGLWKMVPETSKEIAGTGSIDVSSLLPTDRGSFRYAGSLTTPPCSEIVTWNVFVHPTELSSEEIEAFASLYPNDARPVQPLHRRFVLDNDTDH